MKLALFSDQVSSDSSIPLSPQWLYSKPVDAKPTGNPVGVCNSQSFTLLAFSVSVYF